MLAISQAARVSKFPFIDNIFEIQAMIKAVITAAEAKLVRSGD